MRRILFVDDDRLLLDGLRGRLHTLRDAWEMVFVESGPRAITELEQGKFDAIVTDMRMPGMDGLELLKIVRERWPEVMRIVLSGYSDTGQSRRLLSEAHQYLSKPCEAEQLTAAIARCDELHALLADAKLRALVGSIGRLPAMPKISAALREASERGDASVKEIARLIGSDPAIAARVLQVVNSAFFRLPKRITRLEAAVSYLGFATIRNIALSIEVFSSWKRSLRIRQLEPDALLLQAQRMAAVARALTRGSPICDDAMLAGLLHNIGYWILVEERPQEMLDALTMAQSRGIALHEAEREVLGATYAEIGAYLLGLWGLPYTVIEAVALQTRPADTSPGEFDVRAALMLARTLVDELSLRASSSAPMWDESALEASLQLVKAPFTSGEARLWAEQALEEVA